MASPTIQAPPSMQELERIIDAEVSRYKGIVEAGFSHYLARVEEWVQSEEARLADKWASLEREQSAWKKDRDFVTDGLYRQTQALRAERSAWEDEKVALGKVVNPSDVVELSVGGRNFAARRSTLCHGDTMLSAMFSGRWDDANFGRDPSGRIYLELNHECFEVLLEWLRARAIDPKVPFPKPPVGKLDLFQSIVRYLQMDKFQHCRKPIKFGKVKDIKPESRGLNLMLKAVRCEEREPGKKWEAVLGDDTAIVTFSLKSKKHADLCNAGSSVCVQNARVLMVEGFIRVIIDKRAVMQAADEPVDGVPKTDDDVSAVEYELASSPRPSV